MAEGHWKCTDKNPIKFRKECRSFLLDCLLNGLKYHILKSSFQVEIIASVWEIIKGYSLCCFKCSEDIQHLLIIGKLPKWIIHMWPTYSCKFWSIFLLRLHDFCVRYQRARSLICWLSMSIQPFLWLLSPKKWVELIKELWLLIISLSFIFQKSKYQNLNPQWGGWDF